MLSSPIIRTTNHNISSVPFLMSKLFRPILWIAVFLAGLSAFSAESTAQYATAEIVIYAAERSATVKGKFGPQAVKKKNFSLAAAAIGVSDLGARVSELVLTDEAGRALDAKQFNSSEYAATQDIFGFNYRVDLRPVGNARSAAHSSWIEGESGLLMLDDLLPQPAASEDKQVSVAIAVPDGWKILTSENSRTQGTYAVENVHKAVFILGKGLRETPGEPGFVSSGSWHFSDAEAALMAKEIFAEYRRIVGAASGKRSSVVLLPFPQSNVSPGTWEAETRGSTVILVSADTPFKSQSLQRLHEQLRHELFHLWLPNGVNLTGRYDWFYEGFTLYQSLKTAVSMNQIRFDDFLDTLSRAHNIDRSQTQRRSLIDASNNRWNGAETQLYARGMIAAFLTDIALMSNSNGKRTVETLFRRLFSEHRISTVSAEANDTLLRIFREFPETDAVVRDVITGSGPAEWNAQIDLIGLENRTGTLRTALRVKEKPSGKQKAMLDKLGYNNWRKLTRK